MKGKYYATGLGWSVLMIFAFGIITALIPNPWFVRMIPVYWWDYVFLISSSLLMGGYIGVHQYKKHLTRTCDALTYSGGIGSFFAFACPICNKVLVTLFGATALMTYFEPYRPVLGMLSIAVLVVALFLLVKNVPTNNKLRQ